MPARRLFDGPRQSDDRLIVQVPAAALPTSTNRACGLAACLGSALQVCSAPLGYFELMGLLNAAFMLDVDEQLSTDAAVERRWHRMVPVLRRLGFSQAQLHSGTPAADLVAGELRAGRPLLALAWGQDSRDWALTCGQSTDTGNWWGYEFIPRPMMVEATPQCRMLLSLGPQTTEADIPRARYEALAAAARLRGSEHDPVPAYHQWVELMRREDLVPDGAAGDAMFRRHEWLVEALLDARAAAADFLQAVAESAAAEDTLLEAADMYVRLTDLIESRDPLFYSVRGCEMFRDGLQRAEWADLLAVAAEIEARALGLIAQAAS